MKSKQNVGHLADDTPIHLLQYDFKFSFKFHWNLFPGLHLTISQHWVRKRLGADAKMAQFTLCVRHLVRPIKTLLQTGVLTDNDFDLQYAQSPKLWQRTERVITCWFACVYPSIAASGLGLQSTLPCCLAVMFHHVQQGSHTKFNYIKILNGAHIVPKYITYFTILMLTHDLCRILPFAFV